MNSELAVLNGRNNLVVCFGGRASKMDGVHPFEFLRYLSRHYGDRCDFLFYVDRQDSWYHKGLLGLTKGVQETANYLSRRTSERKYDNITFIGTSAGGYAAILFGSLCNVTNVVAFIPQTVLVAPHDATYGDLAPLLNTTTRYLLFGDPLISEGNHDFAHCARVAKVANVTLSRVPQLKMKTLRDNGTLAAILDGLMR
jgi:hypothetical protein